jgi:hypothetical protein
MPASGTYKLSDVAKAAGISPKALNRNIDRKVIKIPGPDPGKGNPRRFSIARIHEIAIGHALTKLSIPPAAAMEIARKFTEPQRAREAGKPFEIGNTFLLVTPGGVCSIIGLAPDQDISTFLQEATVVVNVGKIVKSVNERLPACRFHHSTHSPNACLCSAQRKQNLTSRLIATSLNAP